MLRAGMIRKVASGIYTWLPLGLKVLKKVENIAVRENKSKVILWTDTRFKEAHKMYLKMDYEKSKKTRRLYDISDTVEYNFVKHLR